MISLREFFWSRIATIDLQNRYKLFYTIDDVFVVNLDRAWDPDGQFIGVSSLIYLIHKNGIGKRIFFLSEDGSDMVMGNGIKIIEKVVEGLNLNHSTCGLFCRDQVSIPNVEVITIDAAPYWASIMSRHFDNFPIPTGPFTKKFALWYNRSTWSRTELARHVHENYCDDSFISYISNEYKSVGYGGTISTYVPEIMRWGQENLPILYDDTQLYVDNHLEKIFSPDRKPYDKYFVDIVAETNTLSPIVTEKTVRCLYAGKAFLLMGGVGVLASLRNLGLQTFDRWFDESYDQEKNSFLRVEKIKKEIDRVAALSYEEIQSIHHEMLPVLTHNQNICREWSRGHS
jgi:hypothetical protein